MTNEVEKQVPDEADWALKYAAERRLRMKAERRVASFMNNAASLAANADELITTMLTTRHADQDLVEALMKTTRDAIDVSNDINLNIFDPVWKITEEERAQLANARKLSEVPESFRKRTDKIIKKASKSCYAEWEMLCEQLNFNSPSEVAEMKRDEMAELLMKRMRHDEKRRSKA